MPFYVYIVQCVDGSYYTGHTDNLEGRLAAHETGHFSGYTSTRRPVQLVYTEEFQSRAEALESERRIKGWSRAKKKALIQRDWQSLIALSQDRRPHDG